MSHSRYKFLGYFYEVLIFELTAMHGEENEISHSMIARAFEIVAQVSRSSGHFLQCPSDQYIERHGIDDHETVGSHFINDYNPELLPHFYDTSNNTRVYYGYQTKTYEATWYQSSKSVVVLPTWTRVCEESFLKSYTEKVPLLYLDDIAFLIQEVRKDFQTRGSGGTTSPVFGGLAWGTTKYTRKRIEEKKATASQRAQELQQVQDRVRQQQEEALARARLEQERIRKEQEQERIRQQEEKIKQEQEQARIRQENEERLRLQERETKCYAEIESYAQKVMSAFKVPEARSKQIQNLRARLLQDILQYFGHPLIELQLYGSQFTGLAVAESDVDFTVLDNSHQIGSIQTLADALRHNGYRVQLVLEHARVPIITFVDTVSNLTCDISIGQVMAEYNSKLIKTYAKIDDRFLPLWHLVRYLCKRHNILSGRQHFLSTYGLSLILIAYLQLRKILPNLQAQPQHRMILARVDSWDCEFDRNWSNHRATAAKEQIRLGELFSRFCCFMGHKFDYQAWEVDLKLGNVQDRSFDLGDAPMVIRDPFVRDRNVARNVSHATVKRIREAFDDPHHPYQRQHQPLFSRPSYAAEISYSDDELFDEEEQILLAALERKREQKQAHKQYLREQRHRQRLIDQEFALQQQERRRARAAHAQAQSQYVAEQEAARQYKKQQQEEEHRQSAVQHLFLQHLREQQEQRERQQRFIAQAKTTPRQKIHQEQQRKRPLALEVTFENDSDTEEDGDDEEGHEEEALATILNTLFFPQHQLKRRQNNQGENPCKRRYYDHQKLIEQQHAQRLKQKEAIEKEREVKEQTKAKKTSSAASQNDDHDVIGNYLLMLPSIKAMVEAALGPEFESTPAQGCHRAATAYACPAKTGKSTTPSSTQSSPEPQVFDILRQRQQYQNNQQLSLQEKHSELNLIESTLDNLSRELNEILASSELNDAQKLVPQIEEKVTRVMVRIDSVMSEGELSIRARRKELIYKSQGLLDQVDEFKNRGKTDGKKAVLNAGPVSHAEILATAGATSTTGIEPTAVVVESSVEVESETEEQENSPSESAHDINAAAKDKDTIEAEPIDEDYDVIDSHSVQQDVPVVLAAAAETIVVEPESEDQEMVDSTKGSTPKAAVETPSSDYEDASSEHLQRVTGSV
ncbi:hypothetical protein BGZ83_001937 [Gryganskiella cystojenkinii]|nr:hypothetical protein BGZ83_001937 [Gryganskiella cystojenkinii]